MKPRVTKTRAATARWRNSLALLWTCMRPHQWIKNLFVLAPLLFGKKLGDLAAVLDALLAFAAFCLMASSLYIINDVLDARADRAHPEKRLRPVASGELPVRIAWVAAIGLMAVALWLSFGLGAQFLLLALIYCALTLAYSLGLKRVTILDCMIIASGYLLRVVGGAVAIDVVASHWLILCAFQIALYLAFTKRRQELLTLVDSAKIHRHVLGEYTVPYLDQVNNILLGATVVCYALYTVSPDTLVRFGTDRLIYGIVFVLYGLLRYMALIQNSDNGGDPSRVLMRDKPLLACILGWALYNALAIYQPSFLAFWELL